MVEYPLCKLSSIVKYNGLIGSLQSQATTHRTFVQNNQRVRSGSKHGNPVSIADIKDAWMRE